MFLVAIKRRDNERLLVIVSMSYEEVLRLPTHRSFIMSILVYQCIFFQNYIYFSLKSRRLSFLFYLLFLFIRFIIIVILHPLLLVRIYCLREHMCHEIPFYKNLPFFKLDNEWHSRHLHSRFRAPSTPFFTCP